MLAFSIQEKFLKKITIIGGGLAGLITAIECARAGIACTVVEKKSFPLHKVCGEYVSNEVVPYLTQRNIFPSEFRPPSIKRFQLSRIDGVSKTMSLDLGGFGISRYAFDSFLYRAAVALGVDVQLNTEVLSVEFNQDRFQVTTDTRKWESHVVIGAFGKKSRLDRALNRTFAGQRSPYVGIKYHIRCSHPEDLIALHNFPGGYCGISNIEDGKSTLCYLTHVSNTKKYKSITELEQNVLMRNPLLKQLFETSTFLFEKPAVINEVSFGTKGSVENHVLMAGDAAGMIAPLCGNGMAMAIRAGTLAAAQAVAFVEGHVTRAEMEDNYRRSWHREFSGRLWRGRQIQKLFGRELSAQIAVSLVMNIPGLARIIVRNTHGNPF